MLSVLVLSVFIGLANCQISPRNIETSYSEGKEYKYEYESQVLSGLPEGAKTVAGLKLKSSIVLQKVSPYTFKLQLDSPRFYKINEEVDSKEPLKKMLPTEHMVEVLDKDVEIMKLHLCKPVTLSYVKGHVSDLKTERDDPLWSVNVKRGILTLFELNFNERQSLDRDVPVKISGYEPKIYRVIEPSTVGECETRYRVKPERGDDDIPSITIHKIRDYDKCVDKVVHTLDIFHGKSCHTCDKDKTNKHISVQSSVQYKLLGSPDKFIIVNVVSESHYNFVPYSENAGKLTSISRQALRLLNDGPIQEPIVELKSPLTHERPLKVKMTEDTSLPMSPEKHELKKEEREIVMEMVKKLLTGIEKLLEDKVDEESGDLVLELGELMRKLDKESLDKLLDEFHLPLDGKVPKSRKVLLDILPTLGTYSSVDVILERIEKSELSSDSATLTMMTLSLLPQPDVFIVQRLADFIKSKDLDEEIKHHLLRRSTWLTLGALGRKMKTVSQSVLEEIDTERKVLEEIREDSNDGSIRRKLDVRVEEVRNKETQMKELYTTEKQHIIDMVKRLHDKEDRESKLLAVKVMGSLGYKELLPVLEPLLKDEEIPLTLKVEVVHSLKSITRDYPDKVEKILLPPSLDPKQPDIVRMLSIDAVLHSLKSKSAIELIVKSLEDKPNDNVGHYLHKSLEQLSKLPGICDEMKSLARNSSFARRYVSKVPLSRSSKSRVHHSSDYSDELRMGYSYSHSILFSPEQTSPSYLKIKLSTMLLGKVSDLVELRYSGVGTDSVLDNLLEDSTDTDLETLLKTLLHPRNRRSPEVDPETMIKDIKEKIGVVPISPKEALSHVSIHILGHEVGYLDTDSLHSPSSDLEKDMNTVEERPRTSLFMKLKDKLSIVDTLKRLMKIQKSILLPVLHSTVMTETGLPLKLNIDKVSIMKMDSDLHIEPDTQNSPKKSILSKMDAVVRVRPSALFEMRCKMDIEMKYLRSGISVRSKVHTDTPLSLSINMDPEKAKLKVKVRDEKKMRPLKFDIHTHTLIERLPLSVDQYPLPPERKEIPVIDGTDMKVTLYEIGKETLGRSIKVVSERSVRRDSLVPLHPFSGKHSTYIEYEPDTDDGFDVQFQHVRVDDKSDIDSTERPWYSKLTTWFSGEPSDSPVRYSSSEESSSESDESDDLDDDFIDLERKDLSIDYLKRKFKKHTDIKDTGSKCGLVVHIVDSKHDKKHELQLSTLYQKDQSKLKTSYTVEMKMRTKSDERSIWKMVTDLKLDVPKKDFKPSDLFDDEYQRSILDDIKLYVKQDGEPVDTLLDLTSKVLTKTIKKSKESESLKKHSERLDDIINYVLDLYKPLDPKSIDLKDVIRKQRKLFTDLKDLEKSVYKVKDVHESIRKVEDIMKKSKHITSEVKQKLHDTTKGDQHPEDTILILYLCKNIEKLHHDLKKTAKKLLPLVDISRRSDIEASLKEHELMILETKLEQIDHSEKKVRMDSKLTPVDTDLYTKLSEVERQLTKSLKPSLRDTSFYTEMDDKVKLHDDIYEDLVDVKKDLDKKLSETSSLERSLRVKVLVLTLYQKLAVFDLEKKIRDIDKKSFVDDTKDLKTLSDNMVENTKRLLVKKKEDLDRVADELTERLSLVIELNKEKPMLPSDDSDKLPKLFKVKLDQVKLLEDLHRKLRETDLKEDHKSIREIVDKVKDINRSMKDITGIPYSSDITTKQHPLHLVSVKCLKLYSKQLVILHKVKKVVDDRIHKMAVTSDPVLEECKTLRKDVLLQKEEVIHELKKMESSLMKHGHSVPDYKPADPELMKPVTLTDVLIHVHKVEALHTEVKSLYDELKDTIDSKTVVDGVPDKKSTVKHLKILYDVIDKLQSSQDELEKIHKHLDSVKDHPDKDELEKMIKEVKDKIDHQLKTVRSLEDDVMKKSKSDDSLYVPLHDIQKLEDKAQRIKYDTESLHSEVKSRPELSPKVLDSQHESEEYDPYTDYQKSSPSRFDRRRLSGVLRIMYGDERNEAPKVVTLRLFAKKSVEQLLWELDQSIPMKQDKIVKLYLRDRSELDDPTSKHYKEIKDRLDALKHLHLYVVYEDSLPVEVRKLMWTLHEMLKYKYSDKVELLMPDTTNWKNRVEIISEMKVDSRWTDVMIKTPTETTKLSNVRTPDVLRKTSFSDSMEVMSHTVLYDHSPTPSCEITPKRIKTLRDRSIEVDLESHPCKTVLTMDCSSHNTLAITSRPHPEDPEKKIITILTKTRKVEIIPDSSSVQVKVDDVPVPESKTSDVVKTSDKPMKHDVIVKYKDHTAEVNIPHIYLSVKSDGRKISIQVPSSYTNKLCGICGTLRPDSTKLLGPKLVKYSDPEAFVSTYMVPDQSCDPVPVQNRLHVPEIRMKSRQVRPVSETLVKTAKVRKASKTCFSTKPVKKCPPGSIPEKTENLLVSYHCMKSSSSKTQRYLDIVSKRVLDEVRDQRSDMNDYLHVPLSCKTVRSP